MEPLLETIDLDADEANELLFKVQIQGADPAPARVRMVCEGPDLGFVFNGQAGPEGLVRFNLPAMRGRLPEGTYQARVEVMVENKYFVPVQFQVSFKPTVKVVAEAVSLAPKKTDTKIQVTASPVVQKPPVTASVPSQQPTATLKERFQVRKELKTTELDEDAILNAARTFVEARRRK